MKYNITLEVDVALNLPDDLTTAEVVKLREALVTLAETSAGELMTKAVTTELIPYLAKVLDMNVVAISSGH